MSPTGAEVIRNIKSQVDEVDPAEVSEHLGNGVTRHRRPRERGVGRRPPAGRPPRPARLPRVAHRGRGARSRRPRGPLLRLRHPLARWPPTRCRSCSATSNVASMTGGITLWKDRGYEVEVPQSLSKEQRERYSRHLLVPEIGLEGQAKLLDAKVLLLGAGGLGSPTALYLAAAGVGTLGIVDDDDVDLSNLQRQVIHTTDRIGDAEGRLRRGVDQRDQPGRERRQVPRPARRLEHHGDHRGLRRDRRRRGQLPDPLPAQRRDGAPGHPGRLGLDPRLRRPAVGLQAPRRPVLPLPVPGAAAGRARAVVRRQRRARRAARHDGPAAGHRGHQARDRRGRAADRAGCCSTRRSGATFTELKVRRDPECPICSRDPAEITDDELGVFPDYEAFCAAAG